jgi:serine/threonine protein phosphatase PrpC
VKLEPYREMLEDRAAVYERGESRIIAAADGAGGVSHGAEAAEAVIRHVEDFVLQWPKVEDPQTWGDFLAETDLALSLTHGCGITTAIVLAVTPTLLCGASVEDSGAWLVTHDDHYVLTANQRRKPLIGNGCAQPVSFRLARRDGVLIVATDGLCEYVSALSIRRTVGELTLDLACQKLIDLARMPNGTLQDDVGVVVYYV